MRNVLTTAVIVLFMSACAQPAPNNNDTNNTNNAEANATRKAVEAAQRRREDAQGFQNAPSEKASDIQYSTEGEFDTILVVESINFRERDIQLRESRLFRDPKFSADLCNRGFVTAELKVPGISNPVASIPLPCDKSTAPFVVLPKDLRH